MSSGSRLGRKVFLAKGFAGLYRNLVESGYDVKVLHDPTATPKAATAVKKEATAVKDVPAEVLDFTADETVRAEKVEKPTKGGK